MATVALLGTGLLGSGMVENLLRKGETVRVWNRSQAKLAPLVALGAVATVSPAEAVAGADRVHVVLSEDDAVDGVLAAAGPGLGEGTPVFDHSTNRPDLVLERTARLREGGVRYLSAPVFMSPADGRNGTGLMLIAGPTDEVEAARPALEAMTGRLWHVGERPDLASAYKLLGNGLLIGMSGVLGDVLAIGDAQGIAPDQVAALFDVFKVGNAMPAFLQRVARKGEMPASFELNMARKDVRLMMESAGGADGLVVLPAVAGAMDRALAEGHASRDYSIYAWPRGRR